MGFFLSTVFSRSTNAITAQFSGFREFVRIKPLTHKILKYSKGT